MVPSKMVVLQEGYAFAFHRVRHDHRRGFAARLERPAERPLETLYVMPVYLANVPPKSAPLSGIGQHRGSLRASGTDRRSARPAFCVIRLLASLLLDLGFEVRREPASFQ